MRHLFIIDPLELLHVEGDSSIAFMQEAQRRGHVVETCLIGGLGQRGGDPFALAAATRMLAGAAPWYEVEPSRHVQLSEFDAIWMRKDPPFDANYLFATLVLSRCSGVAGAGSGPVMVNDPQALRDENEKLFALEFPDLCPATLVSSSMDQLLAFREEMGGEMIVKPLDGNGGRGIFHMAKGDRNAHVILETSTANGSTMVMAQQYVPEVRNGDKRIILIEGEPVGAVLRVPAADDARANFHTGGRAERTELTDREREICARLGPALRDKGVIFAGIDVLGDYLTEINVTSPTGVREIERLDGVALQGAVLDAVAARAAKRR
ncbi:MAG: glutathione synthase [Planctomycetota bacterium]